MSFRQLLRSEVSQRVKNHLNKFVKSEVESKASFVYLSGFGAEVTAVGLEKLADDPEVISIEEDVLLAAHLQQGIPLIHGSLVRNSYSGAGLAIAICDTGIDYNHPMLGGGGFPNSKVIGGFDTGEEDNDPMDANGHGTACAGIAAGDLGISGDYIGGVAHGAKLYALKITNTATGGSAWTSDIIQAWEWSITHQFDNPDNPIMIISTSFGGGRYLSSCDSSQSTLATAASNANNAGISIFVSSGNDGYCDALGSPACLSDVISVGAVYDAAFGSYYSCVDPLSCATKTATTGCSSGYYSQDTTVADLVTSYSNSASFLTLLAPSNRAYTTDISGSVGYSTSNYYSSFGGTSAAAPYAAGAGAVLQSATKVATGVFLSANELKNTLVDSGDLKTDPKSLTVIKPRINLQVAVDSFFDSDGDGVPDSLDICPGGDDNLDGDGVPNFCDVCPLDNPDDSDGDGVCDSNDPCPLDNPDDNDGDGVCNSVDLCLGGDDNLDGDGDGTPDFCDLFPANPLEWADSDSDGVGDNSDPCPFNNPDDSDGDGVCDSADAFVLDPFEWRDSDGDTIGDNLDNCVTVANTVQLDTDNDATGDACDSRPDNADYGAVLDAPHNRTRGVTCNNCHSYSLWWQYSPISGRDNYSTLTDAICSTCHANGSGNAHEVHSSSAMGMMHRSSLGLWSTKCVDCHDVHRQPQLNWIPVDPTNLYLVEGTIDGGLSINRGQTTFNYTTTSTNPAWSDSASWGRKSRFLPASGLILVEDVMAAYNTLGIIKADATTITVKGGLDPAAVGSTFGIIYGQLIKSSIATPVSENRDVKFFNPLDSIGGFTDSNTPVTGICQVCHTKTMVWNYDGSLSDDPAHTGNGNTSCTDCHIPNLGFKPVP